MYLSLNSPIPMDGIPETIGTIGEHQEEVGPLKETIASVTSCGQTAVQSAWRGRGVGGLLACFPSGHDHTSFLSFSFFSCQSYHLLVNALLLTPYTIFFL